RRILEAHHLDCQGLPPDEIADRLGCARSTVYNYFRDFQRHRTHILRSVAADRLADQVQRLTQPTTNADQHRQTVAATRELRLLLSAMPKLEAHEPPQPDPADSPYAILNDPDALLHEWETRVDPNGHHRHIRGPAQGQCSLACPGCLGRLDRDPDGLGTIDTEPEQSSQNPDDSAPIETDLDKSGHHNGRSPVPGRKSPKTPKKSRPRKPVGPEYPYSGDNPLGYLPREPEEIPWVRQIFGQPPGRDDSAFPFFR
ncbi:MAG: TetR/AcrR family transcriptional regulator, partial [Chloroflexi bacterium]|nr:TetR/AcrR family transcriptional regulator [Chloroflexota bacterium]